MTDEIWESLHAKQREGITVKERLDYCKRLEEEIRRRYDEIVQALWQDFHKPEGDTLLTEVITVLQELHTVRRHLRRWTRNRTVRTGLAAFPSKGEIRYEPHGVVLIVSPWNYPFNLALIPLIGAIAAGNCVVLKPSSQSAHTSKLLESILSAVFPQNVVQVVVCDRAAAENLLQKDFNMLFFTGGKKAGKRMYQLAAEKGIPVVLELGGKSPAIVDATADLDRAAKKIVWGKFLNAGQTCIAPDYVLVEESQAMPLCEKMVAYLRRFYYTESGKLCDDFPFVMQGARVEALRATCKPENIVFGGHDDGELRRVEPMIVRASAEDAVMQEEIFAPILPVLTFTTLQEAEAVIRQHPNPLALYIFSENAEHVRRLMKIPFGGGGVNTTILHFAAENLPFGGVAASGIGQYHGYASFLAFSHAKSMLYAKKWDIGLPYPPHSEKKVRLLKKIFAISRRKRNP